MTKVPVPGSYLQIMKMSSDKEQGRYDDASWVMST